MAAWNPEWRICAYCDLPFSGDEPRILARPDGSGRFRAFHFDCKHKWDAVRLGLTPASSEDYPPLKEPE